MSKRKKRNKMNNILNEIGIENYIFLSVLFFVLGFWSLYRRNAIIVFMSIEIMLNAVNLLLLLFNLSRMHKDKFFIFSLWL
jgi:NADH-quinone oxidoreductase subunit K